MLRLMGNLVHSKMVSTTCLFCYLGERASEKRSRNDPKIQSGSVANLVIN